METTAFEEWAPDVPSHPESPATGDDLFTQEIIQDALVAIGDEMFDAMIRTSMSPVIYETHDFAVGVTDARGNLVAQGSGDAGFLAMLDTTVQATLRRYSEPGALRSEM